jgi:hypothetical protein
MSASRTEQNGTKQEKENNSEREGGETYEEEGNEAEEDRAEVEDRHPVGAEDVEADVTLPIDVGVVDEGLALDFGRVVRVGRRDGDLELECRARVETIARRHVNEEHHQVVGIREVHFTTGNVVDLGHICISEGGG